MAATSVDKIVKFFENPAIPPIDGEPTYTATHAIHELLNSNMALVNTNLGWGTLIHLCLTLSPTIYANLSEVSVYGSYVITYHKGVKQLIVQCENKIYGILTVSLIYYKKFRKNIADEGYEFNLYNPYVAKNVIKVSQMTVCFHVKNCKLSHKSPNEVGKTIKLIKK